MAKSDNKVKLADGEVRLKNPSGNQVVVPTTHVAKHRLFKAGYRRISGETYPDEVNQSWRMFKEFNEVRGFMVADADPGDTGQVVGVQADDERRGGEGTRGVVVDEGKAENLAKVNEKNDRLDAALNPGKNGDEVKDETEVLESFEVDGSKFEKVKTNGVTRYTKDGNQVKKAKFEKTRG